MCEQYFQKSVTARCIQTNLDHMIKTDVLDCLLQYPEDPDPRTSAYYCTVTWPRVLWEVQLLRVPGDAI
jgi:hypothetical protein